MEPSAESRWLARLNPRFMLWAGATLALSIIGGSIVAMAVLWRDMVAESESDVRQFTALLSQHAARVIEPVDRALLEVDATIARLAPSVEALSQHQLQEVIRPIVASVGPQLLRVVVIAANGRVLAASDQESLPAGLRNDDAWFKEMARATDRGLVVAQPRASRIDGESVLPLARALHRGAGQPFRGAVVAALDISAVQAFHRQMQMPAGSHLALLRDNGEEISTAEHGPEWRRTVAALAGGAPAAGAPPVVRWRPDTAPDHLVGLHRVGAWPLLAGVSVDASGVIGAWKRRALASASLAVPAAAGLLVMAWLGVVSVQRGRSLSRTLGIAEARHQSLVESSPDGIVIANQGRIEYANPTMLRMAAASGLGDMLGRRVDEFLDGPKAHHTSREFDGPPPEQVVRMEHHLRPLSGAPFVVETLVTGGPHEGDPSLQIVVRDLSARRAADQMLRESEERYRLLVEGAPDIAYLLTDAQGVITDVSPHAGGALLGQPLLLRAKPLASLFTQEALSEGEPGHLLQQAAAEARHAEREGWCRRTDGSRFWAQVVISALSGEGDALRGFHVQVRDMSARRRMQDQLEASRREVEGLALAAEAAREGEKRRIARELHDELGQVLTVQQLDVEMLAEDAAKSAPELAERIESIRRRIEDAMAVTRRISEDLRPLVLDDLGLVAAIEWLLAQARARAGITGTLAMQGDVTMLGGELSTALFRIAQECLTNVMRHADAQRVEVALEVNAQGVRLQVSDDGRGIDHRAMRRGLGLTGIEERARLLGGRAEIGKAASGGTRVDVRLPIITAATLGPPGAADTTGASS